MLIRFVKFGLVGCTGIVVDFSITWLCKEKLKWNKYLSNSLGFGFAVINNYLLNKIFTFQNTSIAVTIQFFKFFLIAIIGLLFSNLFLFLLQRYTNYGFYFCKLLVIAIVFFWNFTANSLYTFVY